MKFKKFALKEGLTRISSLWEWFKMVIFHDKASILTYKENEMNIKFDQYYKFFEALRNYNIINSKEYHKSVQEISKQRIIEHKKLVESVLNESEDVKK